MANLPGTTSPTGGHPVAGASTSHPDPLATLYGKVQPPLSAAQKNVMGQYIKTAGGYADADIALYEKDSSSPDDGLVNFYNLVATGGVYNSHPSGVSSGGINWSALNPISGVTDFLNRLWGVISNHVFWVRFAEITLGIMVLGIGISHISSNAGNTLRKVPVYGKVIPK